MAEVNQIVILGEQDEAVGQSLKFLIELEDLEVHMFRSAAAILADPSLARAACFIIDCEMPAMHQFKLIADVRERNRLACLILTTSHRTDMLRLRAVSAGARYLLEKPVLGDALIEALGDILIGHDRAARR